MSEPAKSLLVQYGLIQREQLIAAERLRQREGGTVGECLVRLGVLDEEQLVEFYHKRLLVPRIAAERFNRVSPEAIAVVPADMVAEFRVFPLELDAEGILTLVMSDPSNTHVVDEVTFFTDKFCQRAVARESVLRAAIERHYRLGAELAQPRALAPTVPVKPVVAKAAPVKPAPAKLAPTKIMPPVKAEPQPEPVKRAPAAVVIKAAPVPPEPVKTAPSQPEPVPLTKVKRTEPEPAPPRAPAEQALPGVVAPTQPQRAITPIPANPTPTPIAPPRVPIPTPVATLATEARPLPDPPLRRLRSANSRDEVAALVIDYIAEMVPRAALFVVRKNLLAGFTSRGSLDHGRIRELQISLDEPTLFRDVVQSRLAYRGPLPDPTAGQSLLQLGGSLPGEVLLLPISVRDKVIALLVADGVTTPLPDAALHAVSREAGLAYERIILATKR